MRSPDSKGTLDKQYELPSRKYFTKMANPTLYNTTKNAVAEEINNVTYFSVTKDLWSSKGTKPYLSHFICNWKLQSRCLQTLFMPEDHTGENLAKAIKCSLEALELNESKQVYLTTDSEANIVNAASRLYWERLSCFGHNLHLAITNSIRCNDRSTRALGLAHNIVSTFSMSLKRDMILLRLRRIMVCHPTHCWQIALPDRELFKRWSLEL